MRVVLCGCSRSCRELYGFQTSLGRRLAASFRKRPVIHRKSYEEELIMPGTGQLSSIFSVAPGKTAIAAVNLQLNGAPYLEPVCITPLLVESPDCLLNFRVQRSTQLA